MGAYLDAVRCLTRLSREEEHRLALLARIGDREARDRLVRQSLPLVVALVRMHRLGTVPIEDAIQEGNLGLLRAVETFDATLGTRLATYSSWWIRAYVGKFLKESRSVVRPRGGSSAIADASLDAPVSTEDDATWLDRVEDLRPSPEDTCMRLEEAQLVRDAVGRYRHRLGPLGVDLVHSRIGRDDPEPLEGIGVRWGLSRERVRQVELQTKRILAGLLSGDLTEQAGAAQADSSTTC